MTVQNFTALFGGLAQLIIVSAGACLIAGGMFPAVRRFALRLFLLGIFVAVIGSIGHQWLPTTEVVGE